MLDSSFEKDVYMTEGLLNGKQRSGKVVGFCKNRGLRIKKRKQI